jgi:hypothetical protein
MYEDHYENFFLHIRASRDVLANFTKYTVEALEKPGIDKVLADLAPTLRAEYAKFSKGLSTHTNTSGQRQTGTRTEEEEAEAFIKHVQATHAKLISPYLFDHDSERSTFYPKKLVGLTQCPKPKRIDRYTAYTEVLEAHGLETIRAAGATARGLLDAYEKAGVTRNKSAKALSETVIGLGTGHQSLAALLWQVHCAALHVHYKEPKLARTYFAYDRLPSRSHTVKKSAATTQVSEKATTKVASIPNASVATVPEATEES